MNDNSGNDFYRSFFAVLAGVFSAIVAGFIIKIGFERFLHFDPLSELSADEVKNNLILQLTVSGWLFVSSLAGGLVCAIIAGKNNLSHIIISSLVVLALYFVVSGGGILKEQSLASWAILLAIPFGYFIGEWIGSYWQRRKE